MLKLLQNLKNCLTNARTKPPYHVGVCNSGEACWCRTIGNKEGSDDLEHCVVSSGNISLTDAELVVAAVNNLPTLIQVIESHEKILTEWMAFEDSSIKRDGPYVGVEINQLLTAANASLELSKNLLNTEVKHGNETSLNT